MLENLLKAKKEMNIKMEQATLIADKAADEFIDKLKVLAKNASEEDLRNVLSRESLDDEDKMAFIAGFAQTHEDIRILAIGIPDGSKSDGDENWKEN